MALLDTINALLIDLLGPFGPVMAIGGLGILLTVLAIPMLASTREKDPFERLSKKTHEKRGKDVDGPTLRNAQSDRLERFSTFLEPQDAEEFSAARRKLIQAGYRSNEAVRIYYFAQLILGLGLLAAGMAYLFISSGGDGMTPTSIVTKGLMPGAAGYMLPKYWVTRRQAARNEEIASGFPDSLDMMLVCVEAGQSLDQSIVRVASELRTGFPALSEEYEMAAYEMKAGKDKTQVLRDMAERLEDDDIASFVTVLIQSQTYGTPIAEALRVYASEMRDKRVMRAEEKANTLPTKMTLATMMLTVPPLLLILLGPSLIDIGKVFSGGIGF
ncbi:MAG: pilus assembly protein TadC [Rhodobacterales bacterium]|nr:MAG: pilus assembly protein TadC [Rhodobacterales bacterium]